MPGDTEETATAKVSQASRPREFSDEEIRETIRDDQTQGATYEKVIEGINSNSIITNKDRAILIAGELYGEGGPGIFEPEGLIDKIYNFLRSPVE